ncbi:MAG: methylmalonyl-CoA epimerase [Candidatus Krumholzibacteriota bacterium]|nr:methylmalonyl-CoA epimerase [Candidatus Krumholzibacteriota bacterium]
MTDRLEKLAHIGIAVENLDEAKSLFGDTLGLVFEGRKALPDRGLEVAFLDTGNTKIELLASTREDSAVGRFLEKKGPGIHHLCFKVKNIRRVMRELADAGLRLIDAEPREGAEGHLVAFLHPKSTSGVLIELEEE